MVGLIVHSQAFGTDQLDAFVGPINYAIDQVLCAGDRMIDAADQFFAVSQQCEKNRRSAPLKN